MFAYTCERSNGITINNMRIRIDAFLQSYLHKDIFGSTLALNLDGGQSIFIGFQKLGQSMKVLTQGGLNAEKILGIKPINPGTVREVSTMVKHELISSARATGGHCVRRPDSLQTATAGRRDATGGSAAGRSGVPRSADIPPRSSDPFDTGRSGKAYPRGRTA